MNIINDRLIIGYSNFFEFFSVQSQSNTVKLVFLSSFTISPYSSSYISLQPSINSLNFYEEGDSIHLIVCYSTLELWHFDLKVGFLPAKTKICDNTYSFEFFPKLSNQLDSTIISPQMVTYGHHGIYMWFNNDRNYLCEWVTKLENVRQSIYYFIFIFSASYYH